MDLPGAELAKIRTANLVIWLGGTALLALLKIEWAVAFGVGGLLGFLNFYVMGSLVGRFLKGSRQPVLLGLLYTARLALVFGAVGACVVWLEFSPLPLAAGLATILMAIVVRAAGDAVSGDVEDGEERR